MKDYTKLSTIAKIFEEISYGAEVRIAFNPCEQYVIIIRTYRHDNKTTQYMTKIPLSEAAEEKEGE